MFDRNLVGEKTELNNLLGEVGTIMCKECNHGNRVSYTYTVRSELARYFLRGCLTLTFAHYYNFDTFTFFGIFIFILCILVELHDIYNFLRD